MVQKSALLAAAEAGDLQQVRELVDAGAAVDYCANWLDPTPLAAAGEGAREEVVHFLIERGADMSTTNYEGRTTLSCAAGSGRVNIVRCFVDRGANVNGGQSLGWSPVMSAAVFGHLNVVEYLVEAGADVNKPDHHGQTPLLWASRNGYLDTVQYLVSSGAHVNIADDEGDTPLMIAAAEGHLEVVQYLVNCGADMSAIECEGWTPTTKAAVHGHLDVVRYLVGRGGDATAPNESGYTPLMSAATFGRLDMMQFLYELGGDIHAMNDSGDTALSSAARSSHLDIVQFLVDRGARVNQPAGSFGRTPLMEAACFGHSEVVQYLFDRGADVTLRDFESQTPLTGGATRGNLDTVGFLVNVGVPVNAPDKKGRTALICAAMHGHRDIIRHLVKHGADVNAADEDGQTAMTLAAAQGHLDITQYLSDHGAVTDWNTKHGWTAMVLAAKKGCMSAIEYFIGLDLDINARDLDGQSMLIAAATNNHLDIVRLLIDHGADVDSADNVSRTSLLWATMQGHLDVVRLLVDHGADINAADSARSTPLLCATQSGKLEAVVVFIDCGANVMTTDEKGWTPLMHAAKAGFSSIVQHLISCGSPVDAVNYSGETALSCAASKGRLDAMQILLDHGANANATRSGKVSPLICATIGGFLECVKYLVSCGANPNTTLQDGESAISIAAKFDYEHIHRFLLRHVDRRTFVRREPMDPPFLSISTNWFVSPFEVELHTYVDTGNVGGQYQSTWLDTKVALKLFTPGIPASSFSAHVTVWQQLRHPNVIKLYGACDVGHYFFVCEYASNGTLANYLSVCKPDIRMPLKYLHQAALGLAYLHERKIIHGNLRGSNILVGSDGMAKLTEFGWSGSGRVQESDMFMTVGSVRWQSPERIRGESASFASDVYSLGLCAIEVVTGKVPWGLRNWRLKFDWDPDDLLTTLFEPAPFPWLLRNLIRGTCCQDPSKRAVASTIARTLEQLAAAEASSKEASQPEPEPHLDFFSFRNGDLNRLWGDIERLAQTVAKFTHHQQQRVVQELGAMTEKLKHSSWPWRLLQQFRELLADFHCTLQADSAANRILRLSSTRATRDSMLAYQRRIQNLWTMLGGDSNTAIKLESHISEQSTSHLEIFVSEISNTWLVLNDLESDEDRRAFLTLLKSEIDGHASSYTPGQLETMEQAHADISNATEVNIGATTPAWFVPWYELSEWKWLTEGGFGSVYRAKWLDSEVLVKQMKRSDAKDSDKWSSLPSSPWTSTSSALTTRKSTATTVADEKKRDEACRMFQREVEIWFSLSHPNVVRLFGACHVGNPFFVCEFAPHGSLDKYLHDHPDQMWQKLHEAALGVLYLHERGVVHGDLKCNNIVVGSDWKAKVTDFGLSSATMRADEEADCAPITGAWHWVAPECLVGDSRVSTYASDVFALGMCIVEALRIVESVGYDKQRDGTSHSPFPLPWGSLGNPEVKYHVTNGELPLRPRRCTDAQWSLVERMCRFKACDRIRICTVADELTRLAGDDGFGVITADRSAESVSMKSRQAIRRELLEMRELMDCQDDEETTPESQTVLRHVYELLWKRFVHLLDQLEEEEAQINEFASLIESAKVSVVGVRACTDKLAQFTEMALHGYAQHRRLDKFIATNFVKIAGDGNGGQVHAWQSKCYALLEGNTSEGALNLG